MYLLLKYIWLLILLAACYNLHGSAYFVENKGQWESNILFKSSQNGLNIYICTDGISYQLYNGKLFDSIHRQVENSNVLKLHHVKYTYMNAKKIVKYEGQEKMVDYSNYFVGDRKNWATGARHYRKVYLYDVFEGVDIEYYFFGDALKYNLILKSPENNRHINFLIEGEDNLKIKGNSLHIETSLGEIVDMAPISFDYYKKEVKTSFLLSKNVLSFVFDEKIERQSERRSFIIDPYLVFSTYSGSVADNFGYTATYDNQGNGYAGGSVFEVNYPITIGAYQVQFAGGLIDVAISKYKPNGSERIYATYLGGGSTNNREGSEDHPHSMVVNGKGELIILGTTSSNNFPIAKPDAIGTALNGDFDIFIAILSADGMNLNASTYIGGSKFDGLNGNEKTSGAIGPLINNYADNFRGEVILDELDNLYIASSSKSLDFPIVNGQQRSLLGAQNAIAMKINPTLSQIIWSTYIGGNGETAGYGLTLGKNNALYVTGGTNSTNMTTGANVYQKFFNGGRFDGFISKLNRFDGKGITTYVGTAKDDQSYLIQGDKKGDLYIYGQTNGDWPITASTFNNAGSGMFIMRLDSNLTNYNKSLVFGSGTLPANLSPTAFLVDECDRIFISGWGGEVNADYNSGNTFKMPVTPNALQKTTDGSDFYLAVFSKNMEELLFGTYFGGTTNTNNRHINLEHVDGGTSRFDPKGVIYQSVCASCNSVSSGFPVSDSAWSKTNKGIRPGSATSPGCNNALFKIDFESFNRKPLVNDTFFEVIATESLNFQYVGLDLDKYDSLIMTLENRLDLTFPKANMPLVNIANGLGKSTLTFSWIPSCVAISKDTYIIKVAVRDIGCPTKDSNFAEIKILVKPPPVSPGPEVFCLTFDENNLPTISWEAFTANKYFKQMRLLRKNANNTYTALALYTNKNKGTYKELQNLDFTNNNFCYLFVTENICNVYDTSQFSVCTLREFLSPIKSENIVLVTVEQDSFIKIVMHKSDEPDFSKYEIYRKIAGQSNQNFKLLKVHRSIEDTVFYDYNVSVDDYSYCYYGIVKDACGHTSVPSDTSCSILLQGTEHPFYFTLKSNSYKYWETGVKNYDMYSSVDTGTLRKKQTIDPNPNLIFTKDAYLDYDWGGYFYQYRANNITNDTTPERVSFSNTIYLIQPPLLHVPTAFSPNADGHNDQWGIVDVFVKTYQILVFNRWGEKVYDSEDKNAQWDAVYKNTQFADNVYVWIAYYTGWDERKFMQKGNVTVVK